MEYMTLVETIAAAHLAQFVESPFSYRGGLFLVAPPGAFKSTVSKTIEAFPKTVVLSDINVQQLVNLKVEILAEAILTVGFSDFA